MRAFLLMLVILIAGCTSGPSYEYYETICDESGCKLEYRSGPLPNNFETVGTAQDGLPIIKRIVPTPLSMSPIVPSELPPETFPAQEQWEKVIGRQLPSVIEHDDPSNPNNTLGYTDDGVEIRGPLKTVYLETE